MGASQKRKEKKRKEKKGKEKRSYPLHRALYFWIISFFSSRVQCSRDVRLSHILKWTHSALVES